MVETLEYYTVPEVAQILKVSKSYIYDLVNYKHLESVKLSERRTRISKESLEEFMKNEKGNDMMYNKVVQPLPRRGRKPNGTI
ncbi:helix-turn-helix domain-containing protein [Desulfitobacterium metallireducens]|uniref:Excisionase n=1 Tax=Desulfitobacterium metallireducens DSM 15288 TaxID=871968 RepID=W0E8K4_9FIRM|nr:helix-turn-helix domain-containing protein [Desulfitobacterium metallireducens]AHF07165.1 excisionase [Desulfitobacterium metallireducens DSM 15288]